MNKEEFERAKAIAESYRAQIEFTGTGLSSQDLNLIEEMLNEALKPLLARIDRLTEVVDRFNEKQQSSGLGEKQ